MIADQLHSITTRKRMSIKHDHYFSLKWADVIDYLSTQCDYFVLYSCCYCARGRGRSVEEIVKDILAFSANDLLADSFIDVKVKYKRTLELQFKFDSKSIAWLKRHEDWCDFDTCYYTEKCGIKKGMLPTRCVLCDVAFYKQSQLVIFSVAHDGLFIVNKDTDFRLNFYKWADELIEKINKPMNDMTAKWQKLASNGATVNDYLNVFKPEYFTVDLFLKVFDSDDIWVNDWVEFFKEVDLNILAKVLVEKMKLSGFNESMYVVYRWFDYERRYLDNTEGKLKNSYFSYRRQLKHNHQEIISAGRYNMLLEGSETIRKYLLSLSKSEFIDSFKYAVSKTREWDSTLTYLDTLFKLWDDYGYDIGELRDRTIAKIKKAWDEIEYRDYDGKNIKRAILLEWEKRYVGTKIDRRLMNRWRRKMPAAIHLYGSLNGEAARAASRAYAYFCGFFYRRDFAKAKECLEVAAQEPSFYDCQYDLAKCYLNGWGTEKDIEQAKHWFKIAAENGHPKAQEQLEILNNDNK